MIRADSSLEPRLILKVMPPRLPKHLIERAAVGAESARIRDAPIIAIEAPAGFGKTLLLGQWRRAWLRSGSFVAWLGADEADDPSRFTQAIALSMERATGRPGFARIRKRQIPDQGYFDQLTEWLSEVAEVAAEAVLVIDESDRLPAQALDRSLGYVLANAPQNLRVVLAARRRLPLRRGDQAAHAAVTRLSAEDMRFSLSETVALLRARCGAPLDLEAAARIHELTQGWPLGVQLVIASIQRGADARDLVRQPVHRRRDLKHDLLEAMLAHRAPEDRELLVRLSIVEHVQPTLCEALSGRADAVRRLAALRDTTPIFSASLEEGWVTMHPMIRDVLSEEFDRLPAATRRAVHAAAARWLEAHRLEEEAARHALAAGEKKRAWALAEKSLFQALARGEVGRVRDWFEHAPRSRRRLTPQLLLAAGWSCALGARYEEAKAFAGRVLSHRRSTPDDRANAHVMRSAAEIYADRIDRAERLIAGWHEDARRADAPAIFNSVNQLAMIALFRGRPAEARGILKRARLSALGGQPQLVEAFNRALEGMTHLWEGRVTRAAAVLRPALAASERDAGRRSVTSVTLAGLAALASWECGDTEDADTILLGRLDAIEQLATPSGVIAGFIAASRLAAERGEEQRAYEVLEDLCAIGESRRMPRVQVMAYTELIRRHGLDGHAQTAAILLGRLDAVFETALGLSGAFAELLRLYRGIAAAMAARAARDWTAVLRELEPASQLAARLRRGAHRVEIELLRAESLHARGENAHARLAEATSLAHSLGLVRRLEEPHVKMLCDALGMRGDGADPPRRTRTGSRGRRQNRSTPGTRVAPTALLTPKEREVLELLAQRFSNKQIARALDVGQTTIKWHLKNVFSKLNAAGREHAVQRARMLDILAAA